MGNFSDTKIKEVWAKAYIPNPHYHNIWRKDCCGACEYGQESEYCWEIDHIFPESEGGTNDIENLMAMHWKNNRSKPNDYPDFWTSLTSDKDKNIETEKKLTISKDLQKILKDKFGLE